jgi:hypothetical protein
MGTKVNFSEAREKAEEAGVLGGGDYLKPKNGANRFRLVSECVEHAGEYKDPKTGEVKKTFKWLCLVIDRADKAVKPYFMPHKVYKQIEKLQQDPDYAFDEVPMEYDLTLNVENAGKLEVVYTIVPARASTPLNAEELAAIRGAGTVQEVQKALRAKDGAPTKPATGDLDIQIGGEDLPA